MALIVFTFAISYSVELVIRLRHAVKIISSDEQFTEFVENFMCDNTDAYQMIVMRVYGIFIMKL